MQTATCRVGLGRTTAIATALLGALAIALPAEAQSSADGITAPPQTLSGESWSDYLVAATAGSNFSIPNPDGLAAMLDQGFDGIAAETTGVVELWSLTVSADFSDAPARLAPALTPDGGVTADSDIICAPAMEGAIMSPSGQFHDWTLCNGKAEGRFETTYLFRAQRSGDETLSRVEYSIELTTGSDALATAISPHIDHLLHSMVALTQPPAPET